MLERRAREEQSQSTDDAKTPGGQPGNRASSPRLCLLGMDAPSPGLR